MSIIDVGYPVFTARFKDQTTLVIGGGGGEGKNGIKNKISILNVEPEKISIERETVFDDNGDNPTSLDVGGDGTIYVGVNRESARVSNGDNDHLRFVNIKDGKEKKSLGVFKGDAAYQKATSVHGNGVAVASSDLKGKVHVINGRSMKGKFTKELDEEINDIEFSPSGKRLLVTLDTKLVILDAVTGKEHATIKRESKDVKFSKARYVTDEEDIVAAINISGRKGAKLALYKDNELSKQVTVASSASAVTAMDASEQFVAIASPQLGIHIYSTALKHLKSFKDVHAFAITDITISTNEAYIVSVSAAHTVHCITVPPDGQFHSKSETIITTLIAMIVVVFTAVIFQFVIRRQLLNGLSLGETMKSAALIGQKHATSTTTTTTSTQLISTEIPMATAYADGAAYEYEPVQAGFDDHGDYEDELEEPPTIYLPPSRQTAKSERL